MRTKTILRRMAEMVSKSERLELQREIKLWFCCGNIVFLQELS